MITAHEGRVHGRFCEGDAGTASSGELEECAVTSLGGANSGDGQIR